MSECRRVQRTRMFKSAKIITNPSSSVSDCIVRDISSLGARIALVSTASVPGTFDLTFDAARTLRPCRVAWRTQMEIGLEFREALFLASV
jgi:PilZ domain